MRRKKEGGFEPSVPVGIERPKPVNPPQYQNVSDIYNPDRPEMVTPVRPSIGRIVHYRVSPSDPDNVLGALIRPAMILGVGEDRHVDLHVFCPYGLVYLMGIPYGEEFGNWFWPDRV